MSAYAQVSSRCFGWGGLPHTTMVPMADCFNHSDRLIVQECFNTQQHKKINTESSYYTRTKFMNDFTALGTHIAEKRNTEKDSECPTPSS